MERWLKKSSGNSQSQKNHGIYIRSTTRTTLDSATCRNGTFSFFRHRHRRGCTRRHWARHLPCSFSRSKGATARTWCRPKPRCGTSCPSLARRIPFMPCRRRAGTPLLKTNCAGCWTNVSQVTVRSILIFLRSVSNCSQTFATKMACRNCSTTSISVQAMFSRRVYSHDSGRIIDAFTLGRRSLDKHSS